MTADHAAQLLIFLAAIPATAYWALYAFTAPWWRSVVGRAMFTKATGLMLLCDVSAAYQFLGDDYPGRDFVRLTVFTIVVVGLWFQLGSLVNVRRKAARERQ